MTTKRQNTRQGRGHDEVVTAYAAALIAAAVAAGRDQKDIARAAGVTSSNISQIRSGKMGLGWRTAGGLAKAFGVELWRFIRNAHEWDTTGRQAVSLSTRTERVGLGLPRINHQTWTITVAVFANKCSAYVRLSDGLARKMTLALIAKMAASGARAEVTFCDDLSELSEVVITAIRFEDDGTFISEEGV